MATKVFTLQELKDKEEEAYKTFLTMKKIREEKCDESDEESIEQLIELEYFNRGRWAVLNDLIEELEESNGC